MIDTLGLASTVNMGLMLNITGGILMAAAVIYIVYFAFTAAMVILNFIWSSLKLIIGSAWRWVKDY